MRDKTQFKIIAYPDGARQAVATVHGRTIADAAASRQARDRGEYVDIEQDGRCISVIGPDGAIAPAIYDA
jgi:hypothetical protein